VRHPWDKRGVYSVFAVILPVLLGLGIIDLLFMGRIEPLAAFLVISALVALLVLLLR
jgi:uncharacterized membrane protein